MIRSAFSYTGMDIVVATAAESKALGNAESMKMASRKISIRVVVLYALAVLTSSFLVPRDHPFLNGEGQSVSAHSAFVIAVVEAGIPLAAHFFNAVFVFSSFTCAINSMYGECWLDGARQALEWIILANHPTVASRVLHTLALQDQTGPEFITRRLRQCRSGVPIRAVFVTGAVCLVGFCGRSGEPGSVSLRLDVCLSSILC